MKKQRWVSERSSYRQSNLLHNKKATALCAVAFFIYKHLFLSESSCVKIVRH